MSLNRPLLTLCLIGSDDVQQDFLRLHEHTRGQLQKMAAYIEVMYLPAKAILPSLVHFPTILRILPPSPDQSVVEKLILAMEQSTGLNILFFPADQPLAEGCLDFLIPLLNSHSSADVYLTSECIWRGKLIGLMIHKYQNSADQSSLDSAFSRHSLTDWLDLGRYIANYFDELGFLSTLVLKRDLALEQVEELKALNHTYLVQNNLFSMVGLTRARRQQRFGFVVCEHNFTVVSPMPMLILDVFQAGNTGVLQHFCEQASLDPHQLDPVDSMQHLNEEDLSSNLYALTQEVSSSSQKIADIFFNGITASQHTSADVFAHQDEIRALFSRWQHNHLVHRLDEFLAQKDLFQLSHALVHKSPPEDAPSPLVSFILLDWSCREHFQALRWLEKQTLPRHTYELIWVEIFDRVAPEALASADWVITCQQSGLYHKHKAYNEGLIRARGQVITVCDSDAVFPAEFVQSVCESFEIQEQAPPRSLVLMHHEGRSQELYPEDKLASLEQLKEHAWSQLWPNVGACMSVTRRDAILYGGFDEHSAYQGYICGPYELGWRLINAGIKQIWHDHVFIWHFAHPFSNQASNNDEWQEIASQHIEYHASVAVEKFTLGQMQPLQEHPVIKHLRLQMRELGSKYERRYAFYNPALLPGLTHSSYHSQDPFVDEGPLVSAIVTTYNSARFLRSLIEDLQNQTLAHRLEIIIVDSNSPQNENEIIADFLVKYENIVYLKTEKRENSHVSLNHCIRMARGKYITLACTDDRHVPDAFERMVAVLEQRPDAALAYADIAITKNEYDITLNVPLEQAEIVGYYRWPEFNPVAFFSQCVVGPQPMWRRSVHDKYGYFDPEFWSAGDYEFWLRMVAGGETFVHIPAVLGIMLLTSTSNSNSNASLNYQDSDLARERYWPRHWGKMPPARAEHLHLPLVYEQESPERYPTRDLISVFVRVEDQPEWLAETLASVMGQKYPHLELLVLNLTRHDLSPALANCGHVPVTVFQAYGLDPAQSRNLVLRMAAGRYIFYINSGDRWLGNHFATHLPALLKHRFVYSDVFRLPVRTTHSYLERLGRDVNNSPDFHAQTLAGHFIASAAMSHHASLLGELPLYPEVFKANDQARWLEVSAYRNAGLFAEQAWRYPDWDLQFLAAQLLLPYHVRVITCEYVEAEVPPSYGRSLQERLRLSLAALERPMPVQIADLTLILPLLNQGARLGEILEDIIATVPEELEAELVLADIASSDHTAALLDELSGDIRIVNILQNLSPIDLLRKTLAASSGRTGLFLRFSDVLKEMPSLPETPGWWCLKQNQWHSFLPEHIESDWLHLQAIYAPASEWQSWLGQACFSQEVLV